MMATDILIPGFAVAILAHQEVLEHMNKQGRRRKRTPTHRSTTVAKLAAGKGGQ
jgi:hypothetical protein